MLIVISFRLAHVSGDFEPDNKEPCVVNTKTFTGYLLLSIESITSIGYGYRYPTESCKEVWLIHVFQALCNIALQGILVSAVYVKITMPVKKVLHCIFSKSAVVSILLIKHRPVPFVSWWCNHYLLL